MANVTNYWECFDAIFWDPLHADCAVPQVKNQLYFGCKLGLFGLLFFFFWREQVEGRRCILAMVLLYHFSICF